MESTTAGNDAAALAATTAPVLSVKAALALVLALTAITGAETPDMENDTGCPPLKVPLMKTTVRTEDIMLAVAMGEPEAGRLNVTGVELSVRHGNVANSSSGACSAASDRAGAGSSGGCTSGEVVERRVDGDGASTGDDGNGSKHNGDNATGRLQPNPFVGYQSERCADGDLTSQRLGY